MTSNNVLWLGMLLFLLLVTSCVVHFIDNYNPHIQQITHIQSDSLERSSNDPFSKDVEIDTFIGDELQKGLEKLTIPASKIYISDMNDSNKNILSTDLKTQNSSISVKSEQPPLKIANKIDKKIIPKKEKTVKKAPKKIKTVKKPKKVKKVRKISIESVILTKELYPKHTNLVTMERTFFNDIIKRVKNDENLFIKINCGHITPKMRRYLQKIVAYLRKNGLKSSQIKIVTEKLKNKQNIVETNGRNDFMELSLIERI